jgi:hypothetical protein
MTCKHCDDTGWVCEDHGDRPVKGDSARADACDCAAAICPVCNAGDPPRPPPGMRVAIDAKHGPRHSRFAIVPLTAYL